MSTKTHRNRRKPDGLLLHQLKFFRNFVPKILPSTFDLRPSTFDLRPSTFDLRPSTFEARIVPHVGIATYACL